MATEPTIAVLNAAREAQENRAATFFSTASDYWALYTMDAVLNGTPPPTLVPSLSRIGASS